MLRAVVLLSGGLDSAANLSLGQTAAQAFEPAATLTIDYGQRGAAQEFEHAARLSKHFGLPHHRFDLRGFSNLVSGQGALLGATSVPVPTSLDDLTVTRKTADAVWVPNRNGVLLSLAAALAESKGLEAVAVGFNAEEAVTFPDNTPHYMEAMTGALRFSTANQVRVVSATVSLTKPEIVGRLAASGFPFELLWSCYHAGAHHCGECESCQRLARALSSGGLAEPRRSEVLVALFGSKKGRRS